MSYSTDTGGMEFSKIIRPLSADMKGTQRHMSMWDKKVTE